MKQAERRKFHYIYKITRNDGSGKYYIGMHSTDNVEDGYFGSGQILWKSIKKYGREKHSKEILEFLPSRKELKLREREIVNEERLDDPLCMNLCLGGEGGFDTLNAKGQNLYGKNGQLGFGGENLSMYRSKAAKTSWKLHRETFLNVVTYAQPLAVKAAQTESAKLKRSQTFDTRRHQQGEKNSQFGTCWVTDGVKPVKIKKEHLSEYLQNGYSRGRK